MASSLDRSTAPAKCDQGKVEGESERDVYWTSDGLIHTPVHIKQSKSLKPNEL